MWFATHWIMSIRFKDGEHETYPILERVVLVEAFDHEAARAKASRMAEQERAESTGRSRWAGGRPAECLFLGVRKVICLSSVDGGDAVSLADGQELTCWEFELRQEGDLRRLVAGERVEVEYIE